MDRYQVLLRPVITEKTDRLGELHNQYAFEVDGRANKQQIKAAVEEIFDVAVSNVRTLIVPGKRKRWGRRVRQQPSWKKAIVTVADGDMIDLLA